LGARSKAIIYRHWRRSSVIAHVVENLIQQLERKELEGAVAQQEQVIDGDAR